LEIVFQKKEASDSGLFHHLGKVACRKASRVRISPPPQEFEALASKRDSKRSNMSCSVPAEQDVRPVLLL
jgi:hypothetical protein